MRRRKSHHIEEHPNHERWLVSYADFITLLFAFFVVMYSISSVNEGKYRILSHTLNQVFASSHHDDRVEKTLDPIQIGEIKRDQLLTQEGKTIIPDIVEADNRQNEELTLLANAAQQLERVLAPYIQDGMMSVKKEGAFIEVDMESGLLFASGSAQLSPTAIPMMEKVANIFSQLDNPINVEGHTDNVPINTRDFPSNWELSAARAASVVHQLMRSGVHPARMAAIGHGEYHPVADNASDEGRQKNRRVALFMLSKEWARQSAHQKPDRGSTADETTAPGITGPRALIR